MSLSKLFNRIFFHNNTTPALDEDNLNAMSKAINDIDDRVINLAGTIMEDVPQIQEDIADLQEAEATFNAAIQSAQDAATNAQNSANAAAGSVTSAQQKALIAEGWAKGTQNGTPVGSSSPYYHNNAEYFKDQAKNFTPTGYQDLVDDVEDVKQTLSSETVETNQTQFDTVTGGVIPSLVVKLDPKQDLHGYDKPWAPGAGKNKLSVNSINLNRDTQRTVASNIAPISAGAYKLSWNYSGTSQNTSFMLRKSAGVETDQKQVDVTNATEATITLTETYSAIYAFIGSDQASGTTANITNLMLEAGTTKTSYEPYSNICDISGHTQAEARVDGKNLCDTSSLLGGYYSDTSFNLGNEGSTVFQSFKVFLFAGTYTITFGKSVNIVRLVKDGTITNNPDSNITTYTFTTTTDNYVGISFRDSTSSTTAWDSSTTIQLEKGSTATPYEPYQDKLYTLTLGDTIYGGYVDIAKGEMEVTMGGATFDGSSDEVIVIADGGKRANIYCYNSKAMNSNVVSALVSNEFETVTNVSTYLGEKGISQDNDRIYIADGTGAMVLADFKTFLSNNPLQVSYELATPFTVKLTPQQINALIGENNVSAPLEGQSIDTVEYRSVMAWDDVIEKTDAQEIPTSSDLNSYTEEGSFCFDATTASTLSHCPVSTACNLRVLNAGSGVIQIITTYSAEPLMYMRTNYGSAWNSWYKFQGTVVS